MTRNELEVYIMSTYNISADYPFTGDFTTGIFRHPDNRKWFAVVMRIPETKLGTHNNLMIDVLNIKCDPEILLSFRGQPGIFPAYHMNRNHWLTIVLDDRVSKETISFLLGISYDLTKKKIK